MQDNQGCAAKAIIGSSLSLSSCFGHFQESQKTANEF
jgi:hypothetical protein